MLRNEAISRISVAGVSASYGGRPILSDLGFTVAPGKVMGIMGANGSGKSTLIRVIAGLLPFTSGSVSIDGIPLPSGQPWTRLSAGVMHIAQTMPLFDDFTVDETIRLVAARQHLPEKEFISGIEAMFGAHVSLTRVVGTLSGGEQKRMALAVALARRPLVLLADEVLSGVDDAGAEYAVEAIRRGANVHGTTTILVEHRTSLLCRLADSVVLLREGMLARIWTDVAGNVDEIRTSAL